MSLRVWLPLTKDLRQQGLDDVTITTANTNVFQNEGKLGSKSLDVSGHYAFRVPSLVKKRVFSCSFWYKPITDSSLSDNWRRIVVFDTYTSDGSTTGALFRFESSYGYQSSSTSYCISIHNNSGEPIASIGTGLGATDGWNKWQHITITADGTTLRCYRDGVQIASGAMSNGGMLQGTVHIGYSGNRPVGRLNDFRLYDHCLSPMEIKELSKGLVLHYPLNNSGFGQENLFGNSSSCSSVSGLNQSTNKFTVTTEDGYTCAHAVGALQTTAYLGSKIAFTPQPNEEMTFSAYVKLKNIVRGTTNPMCGFYFSGQTIDGTWRGVNKLNLTVDGISYNVDQAAWDRAINDTNWHYVVCSARFLNYTYTANLSSYVYFRDCTGDLYIRNIKYERGVIATPWSPAPTDIEATTLGINSTTEYDCSGYCNNGTRTGTFEWTSDTPKYSVSQYFNGSSYIKTLPGEFSWSNYDNLTIAAWIKPVTTPGSWTGSVGIASDASSYTSKAVAISNYGGKFSIHIPNGSAWGTTQSTYTIPLNTWHHCVATISGTTVKMYIDGVLNKTFTADFGTATNHANPQIEVGVDLPGSDEIYKGYYSDVRIYATALSAEDVKSLYQNCATIAADGTIYGQIRS